jgi:hypothetical protein
MIPKMRRHLSGTFLARELAAGAWQLARGEPPPADVFLRGVDSGGAELLRSPEVADIDIEWHGATVELTVTSDGRRRSIELQSAIVHEPAAQLYDGLPLIALDAKARRFWRRVFRLVRIPGGRFLLGVMARRTRARH